MQDTSYCYGSSKESASDLVEADVAVEVILYHDLSAVEDRLADARVKL